MTAAAMGLAAVAALAAATETVVIMAAAMVASVVAASVADAAAAAMAAAMMAVTAATAVVPQLATLEDGLEGTFRKALAEQRDAMRAAAEEVRLRRRHVSIHPVSAARITSAHAVSAAPRVLAGCLMVRPAACRARPVSAPPAAAPQTRRRKTCPRLCV
jgi:hypothetical protein